MDLKIDVLKDNKIQDSYTITDVDDCKDDKGNILVPKSIMISHAVRIVAKNMLEKYYDATLHFFVDDNEYNLNIKDFKFDE